MYVEFCLLQASHSEMVICSDCGRSVVFHFTSRVCQHILCNYCHNQNSSESSSTPALRFDCIFCRKEKKSEQLLSWLNSLASPAELSGPKESAPSIEEVVEPSCSFDMSVLGNPLPQVEPYLEHFPSPVESVSVAVSSFEEKSCPSLDYDKTSQEESIEVDDDSDDDEDDDDDDDDGVDDPYEGCFVAYFQRG